MVTLIVLIQNGDKLEQVADMVLVVLSNVSTYLSNYNPLQSWSE